MPVMNNGGLANEIRVAAGTVDSLRLIRLRSDPCNSAVLTR